jgi:FkbM family methyltransferase
MSWLKKNLAFQMAKGLGTILASLGAPEARALGATLGRQKTSRAATGLAPFFTGFNDNFSGIENAFDKNGESWLVDRITGLGFKTLFDVGANVGRWTTYCASRIPSAEIHCFEIVPTTREELQRNVQTFGGRVKIVPYGLLDRDATIDIFVDAHSTLLASVHDFGQVGEGTREPLRVPVTSGDDYMQRNRIDKVDFLKIDAEGADGSVVRGFEKAFADGRIRLAQFEYNRGAILSHFLLRDFYAFFEPLGYRVGRLFPDQVVFQPYRLDHEDFAGPNYIACKSSDTELLACLASSV